MTHFRRWHLALIPVPVVGWLLLAAYGLDQARPGAPSRARRGPRIGQSSPLGPLGPIGTSGSVGARRLTAGWIDLCIAMLAWATLPPSLAWLLGSIYLLFRDAGARPFGVGKRMLGLRALSECNAPLSYTQSFERNIPLLVPYLGPLVEAALIVRGGRRVGDRMARTVVH